MIKIITHKIAKLSFYQLMRRIGNEEVDFTKSQLAQSFVMNNLG